ncbi:mitotic checkpoint serine/threonine-protein kinase BUB1-like isoform X2 [Ostrea edulis]|uniref:mitotic checkpoint serine/threonine-protein kinase BUB1-like isoform X2 n=1 Tax=Ostrea edulis TaxID=37623 RepID=UPI0024AF1619|nr:mitotic checkpoint serine/threonine-protein kinase BUB1-like isoform X2 [Ostrea edulis]
MDQRTIEWELSKENVQPIRQGRHFDDLNAALQSNVDHSLLKRKKQNFEEELRSYSGEDPLEVWFSYVLWTEQAFPKGGNESPLWQLLERCIREFNETNMYKNDRRYVDIWIRYANLSTESEEIFKFMHDQGIGIELSCFYESWANVTELGGYTKKADSIYQLGISRGAQPISHLQRKHERFQYRVAQGLVGQVEEMDTAPSETRTVLGKLKTVGKKHQAPVSRVGNVRQGSGGGIPLQSRPANQKPGLAFQIYSDENKAPACIPETTGEWKEIPRPTAINKENRQKPGVWTSAKVPQRGAGVPVGPSKPSFNIHVEEHCDQPLMTPRKTPGMENQVLSARKAPKHTDPLHNLRHATETEAGMFVPMYCKDKVYCGIEEFSFEELRALKWKAKKRREQDRAIAAQQDDLLRKQDMLRRQMSEFQLQREQFEREQIFMLSMLQEKMKERELKLEASSQVHLQTQKDQLERDIEHRMQQQETARPSHQSLSPNLVQEVQQTVVSETDCDVVGGRLQGIQALGERQLSPLHEDMDTQPQIANNLQNSTVTPSNRSLLNNSSGSSGRRTGPTPDQNKRSFTAPSPTVNTQEAVNIVMGMFNTSLDIDKNLGWDNSGQENVSLPPEIEAPVAASVPFTIFDENSQTGKSDKQRVPIHGNQTVKETQISCSNQNNPSGQENGIPMQFLGQRPKKKERSMGTRQSDMFDMESKMEGIESQGGYGSEDYTIAPVGSHQSFAAMARCASTPFNENHEVLPQIPNMSTIQAEKTANNTPSLPILSNTAGSQATNSFFPDQQNLSPIMEGSNEESDPSSQSHHHTQHSTSHPQSANNGATEPAPPTHTLKSESAGGDNDLNQSTHIIDTSAYHPLGDEQDVANQSVYIDTSNPFDTETVRHILKQLPTPIKLHPSYHEVPRQIQSIICGLKITLGMDMYEIKEIIGKGAFAKVYSAARCRSFCNTDIFDYDERLDFNDHESTLVALKVQKPANVWEFYICTEIQKRLQKLQGNVNVRHAMMSVDKGYFYTDASCLVTEYCRHGSLLELVNKFAEVNKSQEFLTMYLTIELMYMVEQLHSCQIIHGDLKPDNLLVKGFFPLPDSVDPDIVFGGNHRPLLLIDFGQSIDMSRYPPGTTFMAKVKTSSFMCIEMQTNKPWTYQTDHFGLAGTLHVLLFGQYMKVYQEKGEWRITQSVSRTFNQPLWRKIFHTLLNIPSCEELPDLSVLRRECEEYFISTLLAKYNKQINKVNIKLDSMSKK